MLLRLGFQELLFCMGTGPAADAHEAADDESDARRRLREFETQVLIFSHVCALHLHMRGRAQALESSV